FGTESSGFSRSKALSFKLEGIIGWDRPLLYQAINSFYEYGKNSRTDYGEFDVDITFSRAGTPYRSLTYEDCQVKSYDVQTLTDGEESYHGATKWAYIDVVKFDCRGFAPHNPVFENMIKTQIDEKTAEARKNLDHKKELMKIEEANRAQYKMQNQLTSQYFAVEKPNSIPSWIEENSKWLQEGKITSEEYQNMIRYLVLKEIL
ncbi:MAG TPA: hypothetical protein VD651_00495, partial [Nitrosarchaeum sp.]|nr:hypothetical protein [Nitrosarchaeum sp.]